MKRDPLLYGIIGALIGGVVVWFLASSAVNNNNLGMMGMMGMHTQSATFDELQDVGNDHGKSGMMMGMNEMSDELKGKTGDEFDKTFINLMIDHHQGAIDMANLAKQNAKHDEIKNLADEIIVAQTKEINEMEQWFKNWAY